VGVDAIAMLPGSVWSCHSREVGMSLISGLKPLLVIVVGRYWLGYSPGKKIAASQGCGYFDRFPASDQAGTLTRFTYTRSERIWLPGRR
jgi:hypothetical protein